MERISRSGRVGATKSLLLSSIEQNSVDLLLVTNDEFYRAETAMGEHIFAHTLEGASKAGRPRGEE